MKEHKGSLIASGLRFAVVVARFNETFTRRLLTGAVETLDRMGAREGDIEVYWVPGSFEVPHTARLAAESGSFDAVIGLGVLIRGATSHYDLVANEAARGLAEIGADTGIPTIFGIVTAENLEQAEERCGSKMGNRGADAAQAAVEMANLGKAFGIGKAADRMSDEHEDSESTEQPREL